MGAATCTRIAAYACRSTCAGHATNPAGTRISACACRARCTTDTRVSDERCDDDSSIEGGSSDSGGGSSGGGGYGWYYIPAGRTAPGVGEKTSGQGSYTPPPSSVKRGGVAYDGGEVTRGGFFSGKSSFGG